MRIMFIYGPFSLGPRPIDFDNLNTSPRGLTGSEVSCIRYAMAMAKRGHDVTLAVAQPGLESRLWWPPGTQMEKHCVRLVELKDADVLAQDAVYSWNEPDMLRGLALTKVLRVCNQQLNDFNYCQPGWQEHVDVMTSPSLDHMRYLLTLPNGFKGRWEVMPNGCAPEEYEMRLRSGAEYDEVSDRNGGHAPTADWLERGKEILGRVIWASSADRGLHLLLQCWPEIKRRVPHASLRCYYHWGYDGLIHHERVNEAPGVGADICEIARRARYIKHALEVLKPLDVEHIGSVSRDGIRRAFEEAEVLGYPCETIRYTEGFSVTTLEGCASGALPIISDVDALGSIYGGEVSADLPMVKSPASAHLGDFVDLMVRALTDSEWADEHRRKARAFAEGHSWDVLAASLERLLDGGRSGWDSKPSNPVEDIARASGPIGVRVGQDDPMWQQPLHQPLPPPTSPPTPLAKEPVP